MHFNSNPIQIEWFYYLEGDKTKLNWFLMEVALTYYERIMDSLELKPYREQYGKEQIGQYCTYYARRTKESLLKCLRGQRKSIILYKEYTYDFYPHHTKEMNESLVKVGNEAWSHMLAACEDCPQQCLSDYKSRSADFDMYKD